MMQLSQIVNTPKVKSKISTTIFDESIIGSDAIEFINSNLNNFEIYLVGGAIRNIYHYENIRDLELIFSTKLVDNSIFQDTLPSDYVFNRLGGIKLKFNMVTIDLWSIYENWANKNKLIGENIVTKEIAKG